MIEETATVVFAEGDFTLVETERRSACSTCAVNKGCGTGVIARVLGRRRAHVSVINTVGAKPGDRVVIGLEEQALVQGSMMVYLVPLLAMMAMAIFAEFMAAKLGMQNTEIFSLAGGIFGLLGGLMWLRRFGKRISHDRRYQPVVLRVEQGSHLDQGSVIQPLT